MSPKSSSTPSYLPLPSIPTPSPQRLQALYADFSLRKASNPSAYAANVDWWRRALPEIVISRNHGADKLVLNVDDDLFDELRWEGGGRPLALGSVVAEMIESNALYTLSTFLTSPHSIYASSSLPWRITALLVARPLWWLMEQLNITGNASEGSSARWNRVKGKYVVRTNVEQAAKAVITNQHSKPRVSLTETLYNLASFKQEFADVAIPGATLSETDIMVLLKYLERDRGAIVTDKEVIKFTDEDATVPAKITEVDHAVLDMRVSMQRLQDHISEIEGRIADRTAKMKEFLVKKQDGAARSYLRSRKLLEELLSKRMASLETVQGMLIKIESATGDIEVMKAYESSSSILRSLLEHPSLQREHVDATMDSMADALADHAEIENAISVGGEGARAAAGVQEVDESELTKELAGLINEREEEEESRRKEVEEMKRKEEEVKAKKEAEERARIEAEAKLKQHQEEGDVQAVDAAQAEKGWQAERDKDEGVRRSRERVGQTVVG